MLIKCNFPKDHVYKNILINHFNNLKGKYVLYYDEELNFYEFIFVDDDGFPVAHKGNAEQVYELIKDFK